MKKKARAAFDALKSRLTDFPVILGYPNWGDEFTLKVDASATAVDGVLSQKSEKREPKSIAFFSSGLTPAQKNYSAGELECWVLIAASRKFRKYLQAAPSICFISDHNPLVWLREQKDPRGKFARWIQELETLNYRIEHVRGVENGPADFLSRISGDIDWGINDETEFFERHVYMAPENGNRDILAELNTALRKNPATASAINQLLTKGGITEGQFKKQAGMILTGGLLCRGRKIVIPSELRQEIIALVHKEGH